MGIKDKIKYHSRGLAMTATALMAGLSSDAKAKGWKDFFNLRGDAGNVIEAVTSTRNSSQIKAEYQARQQENYQYAALEHQQNENEFIRNLTNRVGLPNNSSWEEIFPDFDKCTQMKNLDEFKQAYEEETAKYVALARHLPSLTNRYLGKQVSTCEKYGNKALKHVKAKDRLLDRNANWGSSQFRGISAGTIWSDHTHKKGTHMSKGFQIAGNAASALRAAIAVGDESTWSEEFGHAMNFNQTIYGDIIISQTLVDNLKNQAVKLNTVVRHGQQLATQNGDQEYAQYMSGEASAVSQQESVIDRNCRSLYERQERELNDLANCVRNFTGSHKINLNRQKMLDTAGFTSRAAQGIGGHFNMSRSR